MPWVSKWIDLNSPPSSVTHSVGSVAAMGCMACTLGASLASWPEPFTDSAMRGSSLWLDRVGGGATAAASQPSSDRF